jgi:hypothetical protein
MSTMFYQIPVAEKMIRRLLIHVHYHLPRISLIMYKGSVPSNFIACLPLNLQVGQAIRS